MLHIALVEDSAFDRKVLRDCLEEYGRESGQALAVTEFSDGSALLEHYPEKPDLIFMDIMMPGSDGMSAAEQLRKVDESTMLIFETTVSRMAEKGYEVDAFDYIIKPVEWPSFRLKMGRVMKRLSHFEEPSFEIKTASGFVLTPVKDIFYVEVLDHTLLFHTEKGDVQSYGTLKSVEDSLPKDRFFKINKMYLINLGHVTGMDGFTVYVEKDGLLVSHGKKAEFLKVLHDYIQRK